MTMVDFVDLAADILSMEAPELPKTEVVVREAAKHYAAPDGAYIGAFGDGALPPEGAVEVAAPPPHGAASVWDGADWAWDKGSNVFHEMVNAECLRRLHLGFMFQGKPYDFDDLARARITGAAALAGFAALRGFAAKDYFWAGKVPFQWIAADNSLTTMDAPTCFAFGEAAMTHESDHVFAARAIKENPTPPADFTADDLWPKGI